MLSHLRRGLHQQELNKNTMPTRTTNNQKEHWKLSEQVHSPPSSHNLLTETYSSRSHSNLYNNPDLSRALRVDASLLAIVRIEDKRNAFYSAEVVSKLRQKEQTQSFINKPCSLFVTDRTLVIFDRATQSIAETIPLEIIDPTCVHADVPDTLNDIFMYRLLDRQLVSSISQGSNSTNNDASPVVVFKCSNNEARILVDSIRTATGKPLKHSKSATLETRGTLDHRLTDPYYGSGAPGIMQHVVTETTHMNHPSYVPPNQQVRTVTQQTTLAATDYYKHLTEELNKCFDDIELFVRYLEAVMEYTKELERDYRRKEKKSTTGLKQMIEKLPDDRYFIDILQKFKHSFNLLGELKHIIHNPNAPELVHYLLSPLQFILYTLRSKHVNHVQITQEIWTPALRKEAKELLLNCLTSKEHEILRNLGPAWIRTGDESISKFSDYRPIFYDGRAVWIQDTTVGHPPPVVPVATTRTTTTTHPFTQFDEKPQTVWTTTTTTTNTRQPITNNGLTTKYNTTFVRQPSPSATHFENSTVNHLVKTTMLEDYNANMQNEHAWAIDRKRAGAKICAVKIDRKGQNPKELTVHRGELIEIEDSSKKWWRARNFLGEVGHVPNNIVEEIEIERRS